MKKRYIIQVKGVFEYGFVRLTLFKKSQTVKFNTHKQSIDFATKFRSKLFAKLICKMYNFLSERNCDLRTFKVIEL